MEKNELREIVKEILKDKEIVSDLLRLLTEEKRAQRKEKSDCLLKQLAVERDRSFGYNAIRCASLEREIKELEELKYKDY